MFLLACFLDNVNLICKVPKNKVLWLPSSFLLYSLPLLLSVCPINLPMSLWGNLFVSKGNLFIEPQRSDIHNNRTETLTLIVHDVNNQKLQRDFSKWHQKLRCYPQFYSIFYHTNQSMLCIKSFTKFALIIR